MESDKHDTTSLLPSSEPSVPDLPLGVDRRAFLMRSAVLGAAAVITECSTSEPPVGAVGATPPQSQAVPPLSPDLEDHQVVANAAESSLRHHLGMTCNPVAGFVQLPCIERCAFGAVKAWMGLTIASNEIPTNRRDLDTTVAAMALTAKEMNAKYTETSGGGLAVSLVLC